MTLLLLSHGNYTKHLLQALRGEMANTLKFQQLLLEYNYKASTLDILELFDTLPDYFSLAHLNLDLTLQGESILDEISLPLRDKIMMRLKHINPEYLFLLSWEMSLGALFSLGIHKQWPVAAKFYVHREDEELPINQYMPSTLLLTESLLAVERGIEMGIPPWKFVYLPHHVPSHFSKITPSRIYLEKLGVTFTDETVVIGCVARLTLGKNCEFALNVAKKLYDEGENILFVLKGNYETFPPHFDYHNTLYSLISSYENEPWFIWDKEETSHEEMGDVYASFDIFLHLSGKEAGSNVVVEALGVGNPTLVLEATTNISLFQEAATFVASEIGPHNFPVPNASDLYNKLKELIHDPSLRKEMSFQAKKIAKLKYSPELTIKRMPLILKALKNYHHETLLKDEIQKEVETLLVQDLKLESKSY